MEKSRISRRGMLKGAAAAVLALDGSVSPVSSAAAVEQLPLVQKTPVIGSKNVTGQKVEGSVAKVYFSPVIDAASLIKLYNLVNEEIYGKVAIKLHTGEPHGPNILPRDMVQALQKTIPNSTIVETNTLYGGGRENTADHRKTLEINGWTFCPVDIMDEHGDVNLPVRDGFHLKEVAMGKGLVDYDSMLVLTHFKGHAMGGFGGWAPNSGAMPVKDTFMELMADSAQAVINHFGKHITFINVLRNMSVDCDCAGTSAQKPTRNNIGILASNDLLAIDQASCDLVFAAPDGKDVIERIQSRHGLRQLSAMAEKNMGNPQYELIVVK